MSDNKTPVWDVLPPPTLLPIDQLQEHQDNPRSITEANFESLKASLREDPELLTANPIKVDSQGTVWAGNQRLKAARELGWTQIPTLNIDHFTPQMRDKLLILDNIPYGEWDRVLLTQKWGDQRLEDMQLPPDISLTWVEPLEQDIDPDQIPDDNFEPDLERETDIKEGDLYQIGPHRLLCC
jgi:hypothetical protein